jgi:AcrR family transcriptional regulator
VLTTDARVEAGLLGEILSRSVRRSFERVLIDQGPGMGDAVVLLADAASRLFLERGYDATTVADIAAAADVSTRTFFSYFPSKEDVLFADTDERIEGLSAAFERGPRDAPRLELLRRTVVELVLTTLQMRQEGWRTRLQLVMTTPALRATALQRLFTAEQVVTDMIVAELGGGTDEGQVEATTIAGAVLGAVRAVAMRWMFMGATGDLEADVNRAFDLLMRGLAGAKALAGGSGPTPGGPSVRSR